MTKKVSLAGRKRTRELGEQADQTDAKKDELKSLQEETTEPKKPTEKAPEAKSKPTPAPKAEPKAEPKSEPKPEKIVQTAKEPTPINKAVETVYQKEIKAAVVKLANRHRELREAGSFNRYLYTPNQQHRLFMETLREMMRERADFNYSKGMDEESNLQDCQRYVDDIREGLRQVNIFINPLAVSADRAERTK